MADDASVTTDEGDANVNVNEPKPPTCESLPKHGVLTFEPPSATSHQNGLLIQSISSPFEIPDDVTPKSTVYVFRKSSDDYENPKNR
uniref:Reverse transcriptase domain-containing protein n=1 Tax=Caenorhabditis japonica TaxID=281687 RepID=A0A8R1IVG1_CAEJA